MALGVGQLTVETVGRPAMTPAAIDAWAELFRRRIERQFPMEPAPVAVAVDWPAGATVAELGTVRAAAGGA
jgi:hypothetical protein